MHVRTAGSLVDEASNNKLGDERGRWDERLFAGSLTCTHARTVSGVRRCVDGGQVDCNWHKDTKVVEASAPATLHPEAKETKKPKPKSVRLHAEDDVWQRSAG